MGGGMGGLFHCGEQVAFEGEFFAGVCEFAVFYEEAVFGAVGEGGDLVELVGDGGAVLA